MLQSVNRPAVLPAIAAADLTHGKQGPYDATGLDGRTASSGRGRHVGRHPRCPIERRDRGPPFRRDRRRQQPLHKRRTGVGPERGRGRHRVPAAGPGHPDHRVQKQANIRRMLGRQGPGLASVLLIAEAGTAALLAAGGVILGIYMSSRRRRYELAALQATGLRRRTLLTALLLEQAIILGFGAIVGIAAGDSGAGGRAPRRSRVPRRPHCPGFVVRAAAKASCWQFSS